jgi:hypothetical protein
MDEEPSITTALKAGRTLRGDGEGLLQRDASLGEVPSSKSLPTRVTP